ncbi:hypothetical protein ACFWAN_32455 [Streptomyces mirabilis]|uniref:hypothetical protein n=1 Tax=Streptomyces mirabilis TaxID=68239 RepID=UPI003662D868
MQTPTAEDVTARFGRAYSRILRELVEELRRSTNLGRQAKRIANSRVAGMRRALVALLVVDHFMAEEFALSTVLEHIAHVSGGGAR